MISDTGSIRQTNIFISIVSSPHFVTENNFSRLRSFIAAYGTAAMTISAICAAYENPNISANGTSPAIIIRLPNMPPIQALVNISFSLKSSFAYKKPIKRKYKYMSTPSIKKSSFNAI